MRYKFDFLNDTCVQKENSETYGNASQDVYSSENLTSDECDSFVSDTESDSMIIYDDSSYDHVDTVRFSVSSNDVNFFRDLNKMDKLVKNQESVGLKTLVKDDISSIIDDPALTFELNHLESKGNSDGGTVLPTCFSVNSKPFVISNSVRKKNLKKAKERIGRSKMDTLFLLNQQIKIITKLHDKYMDFCLQEEKIQRELNVRDTLDIAAAKGCKLPCKIAMKCDQLQQKACIQIQAVSTSKEMDICQPSTSKETSASSIKPCLPSVKTEDTDMSSTAHELIPPHVLKKHQCALCGKRYADKWSFESHLEKHTGTKYTCPHSPNCIFHNAQAYKKHVKFYEDGSKHFVCSTCGKKLETSHILDSHMISHNDATLTCPVSDVCTHTFKHKGEQRNHAMYGHRPTKDFECEKCGKMFQSPQSRAPHLKKCTGPNVALSDMKDN